MTAQNPGIYNTSVSNATASSSAAPTYFNPHEVINGYNLTEYQIDGGTICNNPTLYAFEMSRLLYGHKNTRIISLGTGIPPFKPIVPKDFSTYTRLVTLAFEFMMDMDSFTADWWSKYTVKDHEKNYIRA